MARPPGLQHSEEKARTLKMARAPGLQHSEEKARLSKYPNRTYLNVIGHVMANSIRRMAWDIPFLRHLRGKIRIRYMA